LEKLHEKNALLVKLKCLHIKGGVLKIGQFASCRRDVLPDAYIKQLEEMQDKVPALPFNEIRDHLAAQFKQPLEELFSHIEPEAIACASLAQVHKAKLISGEDVAIKIQTPNVENMIRTDLRVAVFLAWLVKGMAPRLNMSNIVRQLQISIIGELDFTVEAKSLAHFGSLFENDKNIVIPKLYPEYSSTRMIVMEYIDGEKITDYLDKHTQQQDSSEINRLMSVFIDCFSRQVFHHGNFHCDPHPGNFLVDKKGRLVLLDFGSVHTFSKEEIADYKMLSFLILGNNSEALSSHLEKMDFTITGGDTAVLLEFADMIFSVLKEEFDGDFQCINLSTQIERIFSIAKTKPSLTIPENFVSLGRVLISLGGYLYTYKPSVELFPIISPYLVPSQLGNQTEPNT